MRRDAQNEFRGDILREEVGQIQFRNAAVGNGDIRIQGRDIRAPMVCRGLRQNREAAKAHENIAGVWPRIEDDRAILVAARLIQIGGLRPPAAISPARAAAQI